MKNLRLYILVLGLVQALNAFAQTEIFLGPGFGANRNKKMVQADTKDYYILNPFNGDYKLDMGLYAGKHFYLSAAFNFYQQNIQLPPNGPAAAPAEGPPNSGFVRTTYTQVAFYRYRGFTVVPCFMTGNKVRWIAGAGLNYDFSRIERTQIETRQEHYHYDSLGRYVFDYSATTDTTDQAGMKKGSDLSAIVQTGLLIRLSQVLALQLDVYYRQSLVLHSLQAKGDYKSNGGFAVSLMYRLWGNNDKNKQPEPIE